MDVFVFFYFFLFGFLKKLCYFQRNVTHFYFPILRLDLFDLSIMPLGLNTVKIRMSLLLSLSSKESFSALFITLPAIGMLAW